MARLVAPLLLLAVVLLGASVAHAQIPTLQWQNTNTNPSCPVAADDGAVYFASESQQGVLKLDPATGNVLWNSGELTQNWAYNVVPAVYNGTVVAGASYIVYGFSASTGTQLWVNSNTNNGVGAITIDPVNGNALVVPDSGTLLALNLQTGNTVWQVSTYNVIDQKPILAFGNVYMYLENGTVAAYNAYNGAVVWMASVGATSNTPALGYGCGVIVVSNTNNAQVLGLDAGTGQQLWSAAVQSPASPYVDETTCKVHVGGDSTYVTFLVDSGNAGGVSVSFQGQVVTKPAVANGYAYVATQDGTLYTLDLSASSVATQYDLNDDGLSYTYQFLALGPHKSMLYVATPNQGVYGFSLNAVPTVAPATPLPPASGTATEQRCGGFSCAANCTTVTAALGCTAVPGEGSVYRQCNGGSTLAVTFYPDSASCSASVPPPTTTYTVGQCYPVALGGSFQITGCN